MDDAQDTREERIGVFRGGIIEVVGAVDWPEGTRVVMRPAPDAESESRPVGDGDVVIAGFGLAGRCVADLIERLELPFVIIEHNQATVATQRGLGRRVVEGDVSDRKTLEAAGVGTASVLALTVPDEDAVLRATKIAREMNPDLYIIARTTYASCGMRATQLGADDVIKSEQAVALRFYETLKQKLACDGTLAE